jgi:hypothetical protein
MDLPARREYEVDEMVSPVRTMLSRAGDQRLWEMNLMGELTYWSTTKNSSQLTDP